MQGEQVCLMCVLLLLMCVSLASLLATATFCQKKVCENMRCMCVYVYGAFINAHNKKGDEFAAKWQKCQFVNFVLLYHSMKKASFLVSEFVLIRQTPPKLRNSG